MTSQGPWPGSGTYGSMPLPATGPWQTLHGLGQPAGRASAPLGKTKAHEKKPVFIKKPGIGKAILNIIPPPQVFVAVYYCWSFVDRLAYWWVAYAVSGLFLALSLAILHYNLFRRAKPSSWWAFCACAMILANGLGFYLGNANYALVSDYVTFKGMATYVNVNPSLERGDGFADAGEVYFKEGSEPRDTYAVAFKNTELFCIAPITLMALDEDGKKDHAATDEAMGKSETVDWWAVGRDCCNPSGLGFNCGEFSSGSARSGMRVVDLEERQFYELAVHQFTAKYHIPSKHPLFFHWVTDPLGIVNAKMLQAEMNLHTAWTYYWFFTFVTVVMARLSIDGFEL